MGLNSLIFLISGLVLAGQPQIRRPEAAVAHPAAIEGKVHDPSGAPLSGFSVVATQQQSGNRYGAVTSEAGEFRIEGLPAGTYDLAVTRVGFPEVQVRNIAVGPDSRNTLNPEVSVANTQPPGFRRPGAEAPATAEVPASTPTTPDPNAVRRPPYPAGRAEAPYESKSPEANEDFVPVRNRFDVELPAWRRYLSGSSDVPYVPRSVSPYNQHRLKGDYPIFGEHWFLD